MAFRNSTRAVLDGTTVAAQDCDAGNLLTRTIGVTPATIATTGSQELTITAPCTGTLAAVRLTSKDALAKSDTNYITLAITNKGQAGAGNTAMLATTPAGVNTTKATGGTAIPGYGVWNATVNTANAAVNKGDTLALSITATGTLANSVTEPRIDLDFTFSAN